MFAEATTTELVQIISALFTFLTVVFTGIMTYLMARLKDKQAQMTREVVKLKDSNEVTVGKLEEVAEKIEVVHLATNSMKEDLVKATDKMARSEGVAEGVKQERSEERERQSEVVPSEVVVVNPNPVPVNIDKLDTNKGG